MPITLDELKDRVRCVDLFKTQGQMVACPFHGDKTPSLSVDDRLNLWKCFGCGLGGGAIDYFVHAEGLNVADAIRRLADWAGVELEPLTPEQELRISRTERRERCLKTAADYFGRQMGGAAEQYLVDRGFTPATIADLQIGYDDKQFGMWIQRHGADIPVDDFVACGLVRRSERGTLSDFLGGRVVFPVIVGGKVKTLTARTLDKDSDFKYLHLSAKDKNKNPLELGAGLDWLYLEDNLRRGPDVIVVEGPPDTITLHQWGLPVVGLLGVAGIKTHAHKFRGKRVFLAFDNDDAGAKGTLSSARLLEDAGAKAVFVVTPTDGFKDWNDWALAGKTRADFDHLMKLAPTYLSALIATIDKGALPEVRGAALQPVWEILAKRNPTERDGYCDQLKRLLGISKKAAHQSIDTAKKHLEDLAKARTASGEAVDDGELIYQDRRQLVPAMDYWFNSPGHAVTTVWIPTKRVTFIDGKPSEDIADEPYLIRVTMDGDQRHIERVALKTLDLTKRERKRVPHLDLIQGRWRLSSAKSPWSVESFVAGTSPAVDVPKLFDDLRALFASYIHLPDQRDFDLLAVWTMQSYIYRLFNAVGYLHLHGPRASGKSTIAAFLAEICFNAERASSISESVLFRTIEANCSTLMIDEAEKLKNPDPKSNWYNLSLLCNDGYKKGATAKRVEVGADGDFAVASFDAFSPKVFASIEELHFVLASRCIQVAAESASDAEASALKDVAQNSHRLQPVWADLRDRLYCWALTCFAEVHHAYTDVFLEDPELGHLRGREREMWLPLISIAAHIDDRRFADRDDWTDADLTWKRLVGLQRNKSHQAKAREGNARLDLFVLSTTYELIRDADIGRIRIGTDGKGDYFVTKDLASLITDRAREAGIIGPDKVCSPRMTKAFLLQLGAIDDLEKDRLRDADQTLKKVIQIDTARLLASAERYGATVTE